MRCVVAGCGNFPKRFHIHQTPFHCFPKNPELCKRWLLAVRYPGYSPDTVIDFTKLRWLRVCSKHFERSDYPETAAYKPHLKPGSVPSVFPWSSTTTTTEEEHAQTAGSEPGATGDHDAATASASSAGSQQEPTAVGAHTAGCQCNSLDMGSCSTSQPNELMLNSKAIPVMPEQCVVSTDHSYAVPERSQEQQALNKEKLQHLPTRGKYLYVVDEHCLAHNCPLCGSSCRLEKVLHGSLLIITQQCPQCEYCNQWKSQPHSYSPTADGQEQTACTILTGQPSAFSGDTPGSSGVPQLITEITFSDENDSLDEREENRLLAAEEHHSVGMWGRLEQHIHSERTDNNSDTEEDAQVDLELCQICPDGGMSFNILKPHMCKHKIKPHCCNVCGLRFARKVDLKVHQTKTHKGGFAHVCKYCLSTFKRTRDKLVHEQSHPPAKRPYQCLDCPQVFSRSKARNDHLLSHSGPNPKKLICCICNMEFPNTSGLQRHMASHTEATQFVCDLCGCSFKRSGHLKSHMRVHRGVKPFRCQYCNRSFNHTVSLNSHMQHYHVHICHMCNMDFPTTSALKRHVVMHTGAKCFVCELCQQSFSKASLRKSHTCIHTREKLSQCLHCDKSFYSKSSLKIHIQRYHGQVPDPGMNLQLEKPRRSKSEVETDETNEMDNIALHMVEAAGSKDKWCNLLDDDEDKKGTKTWKNRFAGRPKGKLNNTVISWADMRNSSDSDSTDEEEETKASKKMTTWRSKGRPKKPPGARTKKKVGAQTYKGTGGRRGRQKKNA